jgi:hypothetical protein
MASHEDSRHLVAVPDLPQSLEDTHRQRLVEMITVDHAAEPHAVATAQTADRLARLFAAARTKAE